MATGPGDLEAIAIDWRNDNGDRVRANQKGDHLQNISACYLCAAATDYEVTDRHYLGDQASISQRNAYSIWDWRVFA